MGFWRGRMTQKDDVLKAYNISGLGAIGGLLQPVLAPGSVPLEIRLLIGLAAVWRHSRLSTTLFCNVQNAVLPKTLLLSYCKPLRRGQGACRYSTSQYRILIRRPSTHSARRSRLPAMLSDKNPTGSALPSVVKCRLEAPFLPGRRVASPLSLRFPHRD